MTLSLLGWEKETEKGGGGEDDEGRVHGRNKEPTTR